jgi:UDP-glucose 4-epimerase
MRIGVTGGLGRLGRYVVAELAAANEVVVLDRIAPPNGAPAGFRAADLLDPAGLRAGVAGCEVVVHLGGIDRSVATHDAATMQVNVIGTWNLFEACVAQGVRRVVHCSSSSVTGLDMTNPTMPPRYLPIDEAHPARPTDAYGLSKHAGEAVAESFVRRGLEVLVIRPVFVAFPDMAGFMAGEAGPDGRAEPMPYLRAYVGPQDCARGFAAAARLADYAGYEVFFLAAEDCFSAEPTVARMEALYQQRIELRDAALYRERPRASPISSLRARRRLGWAATTQWP